MNNLKLIKSLAQEEAMEMWRRGEENVEHWKGFWESKGHASWEDWRRTTHKPLFEKPLVWSLYEVLDPLNTIPEWRGGMFHSWDKWFYDNFSEKPPKLKDLVTHPGIHNNWLIRDIAYHFKGHENTLMAVRMPNGEISITEGMHRACGIALMAKDKIAFSASIHVMIAEWPTDEFPHLGHWPENLPS